MKRLGWTVLVSAAGMLLLAGCGGSSGPAFNETPALTLMVPSNITAGSQDFTLIISGTGFIASSKGVSFVYWNGSPRSTTLDLVTGQLKARISAADVAIPGVADVTVVNPGPGGGTSKTFLPFTVEPVQASGPTISSLSPSSAAVNSTPSTITITGSNFSVNDVVTWNGQDRASASAFLDQNDMTILPTATDLSTAGTASISVSDPGLVIASPSVNFAITAASSATPSVNSLSPSSAAAGSSDLEVTVRGSGFVSSSTVLWNSNPVATAYLSSSSIVALIPAADLTTPGTATVSVAGGMSSGATFTISSN